MLKGFFGVVSDQPVSYVNAPQLAAEHGIDVRPTTSTVTHDYVNLITIRGAGHSVAGTLSGLRGVAKVVMIDEFAVDIPPAPNMLVVRNEDAGTMGRVASTIGDAGVNIADMVVGQDEAGVSAGRGHRHRGGDATVGAIEGIDGVRSVIRIRS